ncbi:MAG: NAD-dependent epimerase/dehydratase family protein, partial [Bacteroidia bacterium]
MNIDQHVLVTGGAGYIGSVLIPMLLKLNKRVTLLDSFQTTSPESFSKLQAQGLSIIQGDLRDQSVVQQSLENNTSVIYLAGVSDGRAGRINPELTKSVNYDAFASFAASAKDAGCRRFVFASTFGVYGYNYTIPLVENLPPDPQEPYSSSKLAAEQILQGLNDDKFSAVTLRFAMVYGYSPNMRLDFIVNKLIYDAINSGNINVLGGSQIRPQIHIRDVGRYLVKMLELPVEKMAGQIFNACGFNKSIAQIASEIKQYLGKDTSINYLSGREKETSFRLSQKKIEEITGLIPEVSLAQGIDELKANFHLLHTS